MHEELRERFFRHVELLPNGCWLWTGSASRSGWGHVKHQGTYLSVARISWELQHGKMPAGLIALTNCATPKCINWRHLIAGTRKESAAIRIRNNRNVEGSNNGRARLTPDEVRAIRIECDQRKAAGEWSVYGFVARKYKMERSTIRDIHIRKLWGSVE